MKPFRISAGALLYYWPRPQVFDFYERLADTEVDIVYLGETVCSRRHELKNADWLAIAADLKAAGKEAVISTMTLIESMSEAHTMRRLCEQEDFLVEAGDLGAVRAMRGRAFVAGMHLNIYHAETLHWLAGLGARRFLTSVESSRGDLQTLLAEKPQGLEAEVMVWGRMPLAFSSRCFTARHYHLDKDHCEFRCIEHPDGLPMRTRDGENFLAINGIQTQSAHCLDLLDQAEALVTDGADILRVSPHSSGTFEAINVLAAKRAGQTAPAPILPADMPACNGYWHGRPGIEEIPAC